ncbi:MAG: type IV pilus twitching motility protein PilT [Xanthomonadales bacterium]|nr:type IV pilus twitching motility protein PilT [Xanthomonadales bacterium]
MSLASNQLSSAVKAAPHEPVAKQEDPGILLGRIAVYAGVLSVDKVKNALTAWQAEPGGQDFGSFLVAENYLGQETLAKLVNTRDKYLQQQGAVNGDAEIKPVKPPVADTEAAVTTQPAREPGPPPGNVAKPQSPTPADNPVQDVKPDFRTMTPEKKEHDEEVQPDRLHYGPGVTLQDLLQQTMELNASDLHVHSGASLRVRLNGDICDGTSTVLEPEECETLIKDILNEQQLKRLEEEHQVDFAYDIPGVGRFRANAYKQRRGIDAVFRTIKPKPPTLAELGLPEDLERFTDYHQGLMLFTGPASCGKTSTMAAMVDLINKRRSDHILTIEDPIEFVHTSATCNVTQREAGLHTDSYLKALRAALREDPDIIVIGELRDLETISLALTAAETGHLVMGTLHTSNAIRTVNRLLSVFPIDQQAQIRIMMSETLKVVISQRLANRADGKGRVAALEVLINNSAVGNLIRESRTHQIKSFMQTGAAQGQRLLDSSLAKLLKARVITMREAMKHADEPDYFK